MPEKIVSALDHLIQAANHKITNWTISLTLVATGAAAKEAQESKYVSLAEIGVAGLSIASWLQLVGGLWIIIQILNFFGLKDAIKWAYEKLVKKSDKNDA
jgi:hypothetical protein